MAWFRDSTLSSVSGCTPPLFSGLQAEQCSGSCQVVLAHIWKPTRHQLACCQSLGVCFWTLKTDYVITYNFKCIRLKFKSRQTLENSMKFRDAVCLLKTSLCQQHIVFRYESSRYLFYGWGTELLLPYPPWVRTSFPTLDSGKMGSTTFRDLIVILDWHWRETHFMWV